MLLLCCCPDLNNTERVVDFVERQLQNADYLEDHLTSRARTAVSDIAVGVPANSIASLALNHFKRLYPGVYPELPRLRAGQRPAPAVLDSLDTAIVERFPARNDPMTNGQSKGKSSGAQPRGARPANRANAPQAIPARGSRAQIIVVREPVPRSRPSANSGEGAPVSIANRLGKLGSSPVNPIKGALAAQKFHVLLATYSGIASTASVPSFIIYGAPLNPQFLARGTRLAYESAVYDSFKFRKATLRWVPTCPTSTYGDIALLYDADPNDYYPDVAAGPTPILEEEQVTMASAWTVNKLNIKFTATMPKYFMDEDGSAADERLTNMGRIAVFQMSGPTSGNNITGYILLSGIIDFFDSRPAPAYGIYGFSQYTLWGEFSYSTITTPAQASGQLALISALDGLAFNSGLDGLVFEILIIDPTWNNLQVGLTAAGTASGFIRCGDVIYGRMIGSNSTTTLCIFFDLDSAMVAPSGASNSALWNNSGAAYTANTGKYCSFRQVANRVLG